MVPHLSAMWSNFLLDSKLRFNNNYYISLVAKGWTVERAISGNVNKNQWDQWERGHEILRWDSTGNRRKRNWPDIPCGCKLGSYLSYGYLSVIKHGWLENTPFIDDVPITTFIYDGFPIATFDYRRVYTDDRLAGWLQHKLLFNAVYPPVN